MTPDVVDKLITPGQLLWGLTLGHVVKLVSTAGPLLFQQSEGDLRSLRQVPALQKESL